MPLSLDAKPPKGYPTLPLHRGRSKKFRLERFCKKMAFAVAIPSRAPSEHRDLAFWMNRTLEELAELRFNPSADAVHDFRVALRRCRSVAAAVAEIDSHPDWEEMRSGARKLFRSMGDLRDAQITEGWIRELCPQDDAIKVALIESLKLEQEEAQAKALHLAEKFDEKRWSELARSLRTRLRKIPADGDAARCLALERVEEAQELHRRALRTESPRPWHDLRIGIKRFRYTLELLVPSLHVKCIDSLKRVQDVLGDVHDLDMLLDKFADWRNELDPELMKDWQARASAIRQEKLQSYRQFALGGASIWQHWLGSFPRHDWPAYSRARISATRKAMDRRPSRSLAVSRIALRLWSQLRASGAKPFADAKERRVLEAAARLSGIRYASGRKPRIKSARTFLLNTPVPPAWSFPEWERVAWSIRFQRGPDPSPANKRFSKLAIEQQFAISLLTGVLRIAVAAQRSGVRCGAAIKIEPLQQGLLLRVEGVEETPEVAARFAEAKRMLEHALGKTILVQPTNRSAIDQARKAIVLPAIAMIR
jgi:CHAD domain-containing protein